MNTTRITIGLLPKVEVDLAALADNLGMSKSDIVNRAVTLYRFVQGQIDEGAEILVKSGAGLERIRLL